MKQPLYSLLYNQSFIHNGHKYTVKQQTYGMTEVFGLGKLWCWPHYDGTNSLKVDVIVTHPERVNFKETGNSFV